jgi:hypothetical protein
MVGTVYAVFLRIAASLADLFSRPYTVQISCGIPEGELRVRFDSEIFH